MIVNNIRWQTQYGGIQKDLVFCVNPLYQFQFRFLLEYMIKVVTLYISKVKKNRNKRQAHLKSQIHLYYPILSLHQIQLIMSIQQITILVVDIRIFTIL